MVKQNKDYILQIKVTQKEKEFIEKFILQKSLLDAKRYSLSSFLSMSLMEKLNNDYNNLIDGGLNGI